MTPQVTDRFYTIIHRAYDLLDRLEKDPSLGFEVEQSQFTSLRHDLRRLDAETPYPQQNGSSEGLIESAVCFWLDELFTVKETNSWKEKWSNEKLEGRWFERNSERATRFWQEANTAHNVGNWDAVEVFLVCVLLGFEGQPPSETLEHWVRERRAVLQRIEEANPDPRHPDLGPLAQEHRDKPLLGYRMFAKMLRVGSIGAGVALGFGLLVVLWHILGT